MSQTRDFDIRVRAQKDAEKRIGDWVAEHGYAKGMHGFCDHKSGLPRTPNVMVRPSFAPHAGSRTVMVTFTELLIADIEEPYQRNTWKVVHTVPYSGLPDLKAKLDAVVYKDMGVWKSEVPGTSPDTSDN